MSVWWYRSMVSTLWPFKFGPHENSAGFLNMNNQNLYGHIRIALQVAHELVDSFNWSIGQFIIFSWGQSSFASGQVSKSKWILEAESSCNKSLNCYVSAGTLISPKTVLKSVKGIFYFYDLAARCKIIGGKVIFLLKKKLLGVGRK